MKIINLGEISQEAAPPNPGFEKMMTGKVRALQLAPDSKDIVCSLITFSKGVRNRFHTHSCDQLLIVTAGKGIVATEKEQVVVTAGDVILFPAGEKHWHGATDDSEFSHIFVLKPGNVTTQVEA